MYLVLPSGYAPHEMCDTNRSRFAEMAEKEKPREKRNKKKRKNGCFVSSSKSVVNGEFSYMSFLVVRLL